MDRSPKNVNSFINYSLLYLCGFILQCLWWNGLSMERLIY